MRVYALNGPPDFRRQANEYLDGGQYSLALNLAKERLISHPEDIPAIVIACKSCLGAGNDEEARHYLDRLEPVCRELSQLFREFGDFCTRRGEEQRARGYYRISGALSPEGGDAAGTAAPVAAMDEDEESPEDSSELGADFQTMTMADLYIRQGHYEGARGILAAILARNPDHAEARERLDEVLARLSEKIDDLPIDKKTAVVHELSRWLNTLRQGFRNGG